MFHLLHWFAREKNQMAPMMYKALTFLLLDCFNEPEQRGELLYKFIELFATFRTVPLAILCEPLLRLVRINLEKLHPAEEPDALAALRPPLIMFQFNTVDFEFFMMLAQHEKLAVDFAIELMEIVSLIARKQILFTRVSLNIVLVLLNRFDHNLRFQACYEGLITSLMRELEA